MKEPIYSLNYTDYPAKQTIEIEGVNYHYDFFKHLGGLVSLNKPFKIVKRRDKSITIKRILGCPFMKEGC